MTVPIRREKLAALNIVGVLSSGKPVLLNRWTLAPVEPSRFTMPVRLDPGPYRSWREWISSAACQRKANMEKMFWRFLTAASLRQNFAPEFLGTGVAFPRCVEN
jgi:hypothetical protein